MNPLNATRSFVLDLAKALNQRPESTFDRPLGGDKACLTPRRIVHIVRAGASSEDLRHLMTCRPCRETLVQLEGKRLDPDPDFVASAMKLADEPVPAPWERKARKERTLLAAVLGRETDTISVGEASGGQLRLVLDLFPVFRPELLRRLAEGSLRVSGAFTASSGRIAESIDLDDDSVPDALRISFESGQLAARVRDAIRDHRRAIDTVEVRARFEGSDQELVGRAELEFRE